MKRINMILVALASLFLAGGLFAQDPDVTPRSFFIPSQAQQPDETQPVDLRVCVENVCFRNNSNRSAYVYVDITTFTTTSTYITAIFPDGSVLNYCEVIYEFETWWVRIKVPPGWWVWIDVWVDVPSDEGAVIDIFGDDILTPAFVMPLSVNTRYSNDDGSLSTPENISASTLQMRKDARGTAASSLDLMPGDGEPWSIEKRYLGGKEYGKWISPNDPSISQNTESKLTYKKDGHELLIKADLDQDGAFDRLTRSTVQNKDGVRNSSVTVDLDGKRTFTLSGEMMKRDNGYVSTTSTDSDGDGAPNMTATSSASSRDGITRKRTERDTNADGVTDEIETVYLERISPTEGRQLTRVTNGSGDLQWQVRTHLKVEGASYTLETFHDDNGDGVFEMRDMHQAELGAFANGVDRDTFLHDYDNDGVWDAARASTAHKRLDENGYHEVIQNDLGADGVIDATSLRRQTFTNDQKTPKPEKIDQ